MVHASAAKPPRGPLVPAMQPMRTPHWTAAFTTVDERDAARLSRKRRDLLRYRDGTLRPDRPRHSGLSLGYATRSEASLRHAPTNKQGALVPGRRLLPGRLAELGRPPGAGPHQS